MACRRCDYHTLREFSLFLLEKVPSKGDAWGKHQGRKAMPARSRNLFHVLLRTLQQRLPFLLFVAVSLLIGFFAWSVVASITAYDEDKPLAGIEKVENGKFLGLKVHDNTSDKIMQNPYLRLAMNEGFRSADVVRRHQMGEIWLHDGQHPDSGEPAVMITVEPKPHEIPRPPFESVAVRRWKPGEDDPEYDAQAVVQRQLTRTPNEEDLAAMRDNWSGHRYQEATSLIGMIRRLLALVVIALSVVLIAGIYRSYLYFATQSQLGADGTRGDAALGKLKAAHATRRAQEQMDQPGR
jgi:hypothetical protein